MHLQVRRACLLGLLFSLSASVHVGCSSDTTNSTLEDGSNGSNSSATTQGGLTTGGVGVNGSSGGIGTGGTASTGGGGETSCQSNDDCSGSQVCHPTSLVCVSASGDCNDQSDCSGGTSCDVGSGRCLPGLTGSPCESDANCEGAATCSQGICGCSGLANEQELVGGALDIYFIFDRTASMGNDCDYVPGDSPPVDSKACFATYAFPDYLTSVDPTVQDVRLAFQFMSLPGDGCDGGPYATPLVDLTALPVPADHQIIQEISNESFGGGYGTEIEGALNGLASFTAAHQVSGREMIGVLMTDGDPNGCEQDVSDLAQIISDHLAATGIRTFIIGMEGASGDRLEAMGIAGGAEPHDDYCSPDGPSPCHHWNVGDGSGEAIADALRAIVAQAAPLACEYDVVNLQPPDGETLDYGKINVTLSEGGTTTTIGKAANADACPVDEPAWYYDNPNAPTRLMLCDNACDLASGAEQGARLNIVVGCRETVEIEIPE